MPGQDAIERFRALLRIPTVSFDGPVTEPEPFDRFLAMLPELYPTVFAQLECERVDGYSLLARWPGARSEGPTVLMAHYDVVPASEEGWTHPPFGATLVGAGTDQVLWGRGTLDDKGALVALLEAAELLALQGWAPEADVWFSFGHNEETAGTGAVRAVDVLESRGIRPRLVLDEGGAIVEGIFPGVKDPIAVVGVSEKGITTVTLTVDQAGGHASTPPRMTSTVRLARAIMRLSKRRFPAAMNSTTIEMIGTLGQHTTGPLRFVFTRAQLFRLPLRALLGRLSDETAALLRTTAAVTQLSGAMAANALPERAQAVVNVRIAAGSSVAAMLAHVRRAVRDPLVRIEAQHPSEPSPFSPAAGPAWQRVVAAINGSYPEAIVTPYVMLGATDSRHFTRISPNVYRFTPFEMSTDERATLHAIDERIRVSTWLTGIGFYRRLLESS